MEDRRKELEKDIEMEQFDYDNSCENPTKTTQFFLKLERQRVKLNKMKTELKKLNTNQNV